MKKLVALLLALTMVLGLCGAVSAEEHEEITLTLGSIWSSDSEATKAPFLKTLEEFQQEYPWIHVEVDMNEAEAWRTKIKTMVQAGEQPDVFYYNAGGLLKAFVDAGAVMPLNDYLDEETRSRIIEGTLSNMTFDGKIYGLPYTLACSVMYCNTELFEKHGVKIPETWDELLEAVRTFSAAGVTPMAVGGKDRWPTNMYMDIINLRFAGYDECYNAFYKTENGSFLTENWVKSVEAFVELVNAGAFPRDAAALTRDESEVPFYAGQIPMYVNGQWTAANCQADSSAIKGKTVAIKFPAVEGKDTAYDFMGGAAEQFCVSANTQHPEEAFLLCRYIAENLSKNGYIAGAGLPAWKADFSGYEIDPLTSQIVDLTNDATSFLLWGNTALEGADSELLMDTLLELLMGDITAQDFCEIMETIFE